MKTPFSLTQISVFTTLFLSNSHPNEGVRKRRRLIVVIGRHSIRLEAIATVLKALAFHVEDYHGQNSHELPECGRETSLVAPGLSYATVGPVAHTLRTLPVILAVKLNPYHRTYRNRP